MYGFKIMFQGKNILITGAAQGIGANIAEKFAAHGANIIINYYNSSDKATKLASELSDTYNVKTLTVAANVARKESIAEMYEQVASTFPTIDILVNNAASGVLKSVMEMSLKHWRYCMEVNAFALVEMLQKFVNVMPKGGRVIALSSIGASRALPNYGFVGASKAALESLVRSLSIELAPRDIALNVVSAGAVDTNALQYFPNYQELLSQARDKSLTNTNITPKDVADVVYLLCQPEAHLIRGQTIYVDAGYSIIG